MTLYLLSSAKLFKEVLAKGQSPISSNTKIVLYGSNFLLGKYGAEFLIIESTSKSPSNILLNILLCLKS